MKIKFIYLLLVSIVFSLLISCSKSSNDTPEKPILPVTKDTTKKDPTITNIPKRDTIIFQQYEVTDFPVLRKSFADSIALGMFTTQSGSLLTSYPKMAILSDNYWDKERLYTSAIGDSFYFDGKPNKQNQNAFVQSFLKADHSFKQWAGAYVFSKGLMSGRFNELRTYLNVNEDVQNLFGLDKSDTAFIDTTYKRLVYNIEATKFNALIESNPYGPYTYSNIINGSKEWSTYFGSNAPLFVNNINFGYGATMVFESKNTYNLESTVSHLFDASIAKLKDGTAISSLSTEDQTIISNTKLYGYKLGVGKISSNQVSDGIKDIYSYITKVTEDNNFIGYPIRYSVNGYKKDDPIAKLNFTVGHYSTYQPVAK